MIYLMTIENFEKIGENSIRESYLDDLKEHTGTVLKESTMSDLKCMKTLSVFVLTEEEKELLTCYDKLKPQDKGTIKILMDRLLLHQSGGGENSQC